MNALSNITTIVKQHSKSIYYSTLFCLLLAIISAGGMMIDDRTLTGVNVWLKPFKFAISTAIYVFTVGYFTYLYGYSQRKKAIINHLTAWTLSIELVIIVMQGARGVQSHYNMSSPMDGLLFAAMGILIGINVMIMCLFLVDTLRAKPKVSKTVLMSLALGWISILFGSYVGGQMIGQMSHSVGVADGTPGMALINWSLQGGDLRIAHFFGIHGLQLIPMTGYFWSRKFKDNNFLAVTYTTLFSIVYLGIIALTFYQAKQGNSLISLFLQGV